MNLFPKKERVITISASYGEICVEFERKTTEH